ncbi:hypothetical protein HMPREF9372_3801 [Sporosarcina newyorkensis 2681]|uniref:Uncharacterized protein n=1 Tax=Sporosarcina newyorkensis 2681 TaxID=1027292 RepID=F9DYC0_9BACL|nr:hypothetical protein HMPREF9372_3801 [Sporosarcina newyorkensis 2681]
MGDFTGFRYLLLLLSGVVIFIVGLVKINTARGSKAFIPLVTGGLFVSLSVFLLTPNGSEIIADLLNLQ